MFLCLNPPHSQITILLLKQVRECTPSGKKKHIISFPNSNRQDVSVLLAMDCMLVTSNILSIYEVSIISALKKLSSMEIKYMVSESEPRCSSYSIYSSSSNCVAVNIKLKCTYGCYVVCMFVDKVHSLMDTYIHI